MPAGRVLHLPGAYVRVIERDIYWLESQPEQPPRGLERRLDHALELEIGLDLGFLQIVARLPQLLGVIAPIPGSEREIAALCADHRLQFVALAPGPRTPALPDIVEQFAYRFRRLRHLIGEAIIG